MPFGNPLSLRAWPCPGPASPLLPPGAPAGLGPAVPVAPRWCAGMGHRCGMGTVPWGEGCRPCPAIICLWGGAGGRGSRRARSSPAVPRPGTRPSCSPRSPGDACQCLTGGAAESQLCPSVLPGLSRCLSSAPAGRTGHFPGRGSPAPGQGPPVTPPSLPLVLLEPGRCYLKSLFCLCMEKYYLL